MNEATSLKVEVKIKYSNKEIKGIFFFTFVFQSYLFNVYFLLN